MKRRFMRLLKHVPQGTLKIAFSLTAQRSSCSAVDASQTFPKLLLSLSVVSSPFPPPPPTRSLPTVLSILFLFLFSFLNLSPLFSPSLLCHLFLPLSVRLSVFLSDFLSLCLSLSRPFPLFRIDFLSPPSCFLSFPVV